MNLRYLDSGIFEVVEMVEASCVRRFAHYNHTGKSERKRQCTIGCTCLAASLQVSHSKTSNGEIFLWLRTVFGALCVFLRVSVAVLSDGPLMLRVTIW
jgi:hypothetical protein